MQFDLFHEIALPPAPSHRSSGVRRCACRNRVRRPLGLRCAWLAEHHFTRGYSHSSKPELVLAALSQRTRRLRLGHAVIPLHCTIQCTSPSAWRASISSRGRLEVGIGRGFAPAEYAAFGVAMEQSRARVDEALDIIFASFLRQRSPTKARIFNAPRSISCRTWCSRHTRQCGPPR